MAVATPFGILGPSWLILHAAWLAEALQRACGRMAHNSWHAACLTDISPMFTKSQSHFRVSEDCNASFSDVKCEI